MVWRAQAGVARSVAQEALGFRSGQVSVRMQKVGLAPESAADYTLAGMAASVLTGWREGPVALRAATRRNGCRICCLRG